MDDLNHFKHLELIEGDSAESLTLKLKAISITFQIINVWSDGKRHYAHINAGRPLPLRFKEKISKVK